MNIRLVLFYVEYCPYRKQMKKQWYKFLKLFSRNELFDTITVEEFDLADFEDVPYNILIDSFPTIVLLIDDKEYSRYNGSLHANQLIEYLQNIIYKINNDKNDYYSRLKKDYDEIEDRDMMFYDF